MPAMMFVDGLFGLLCFAVCVVVLAGRPKGQQTCKCKGWNYCNDLLTSQKEKGQSRARACCAGKEGRNASGEREEQLGGGGIVS
jgi:hypothetical protein